MIWSYVCIIVVASGCFTIMCFSYIPEKTIFYRTCSWEHILDVRCSCGHILDIKVVWGCFKMQLPWPKSRGLFWVCVGFLHILFNKKKSPKRKLRKGRVKRRVHLEDSFEYMQVIYPKILISQRKGNQEKSISSIFFLHILDVRICCWEYILDIRLYPIF